MKPLFEIKDFSGGYADQYGRGKEPQNTFLDSKNLIPTKVGSLETTHGYALDVAAFPTGFMVATQGSTSQFSLMIPKASPFAFSAEVPTAYDGRVYFVEDSNSTNHVCLDYWFKGGTRETTHNDGWVLLDERKILDGNHADVTLGASSVTIANAADHGLIVEDGYYDNWVMIHLRGSSYLSWHITTQTVSGSSVIFNVLTRPSDLTKTAGDVITVQRWFHRA